MENPYNLSYLEVEVEAIINSIQNTLKTKAVLTVEEHSIHGGIGSLIGEIILSKQLNCTMLKSGVPSGSFVPAYPGNNYD